MITNPSAQQLLSIIHSKQSNLCVSADVPICAQVLEIAKIAGPYICMLKTHVDILTDFSPTFTQELSKLAKELNFIIFEDRKFADIGNTVHLQYSAGIYRIASWSHITNCHVLPGEGIINGLKKAGLVNGCGLLLLAQMSSKGNLMDEGYSQKALEMARNHRDFVIGFISQKNLGDDSFLYMTPGVSLDKTGDALGQQYRTIEDAIHRDGCDIVIVGRSIIESDIESQAKRYRDESWRCYKQKFAHRLE